MPVKSVLIDIEPSQFYPLRDTMEEPYKGVTSVMDGPLGYLYFFELQMIIYYLELNLNVYVR